MRARASAARNDYRCSMERNQAGKYCVRIQATYPRHAWTLTVFFLAGSFDRAMKKLEESLDFLQRHEEKLWFWGVDRAEDMGFSAEFLREAGLKLDRRTEFSRKTARSDAISPSPSKPPERWLSPTNVDCSRFACPPLPLDTPLRLRHDSPHRMCPFLCSD